MFLLGQELQFMECFAGEAAISRSLWQDSWVLFALLRVWFESRVGVPLEAGLCGGANDIEYDPKTMDLLSPAGFSCPGYHRSLRGPMNWLN